MALFDALDSDLDDIAARCTDDDAGVRRVAMLELAEVTDEGAVPLLVKGLGDADPAVREAAAKALDEHSGEGIVSALVNALEDPVAAVRVAAAETLAEKKDPESVALLIARVDHPEPFVRARRCAPCANWSRRRLCPRRFARSRTNLRRSGGRRSACSAISRPTRHCRR